MADTITALDTATTDELIAALVARHRATLGQACSQLDDLDLVATTALALGIAFAKRVRDAVGEATGRYIADHPAERAASIEQKAAIMLRILRG